VTGSPEALFTPRFFLMCGFTLTVFLSVFQLLPTAPFHITDLGGSSLQAGLFLGLLAFASAVSAPVTGALADRLGGKRTLVVSSFAITSISLVYAVAPNVVVLLVFVPVHGIFWSGLLSASAAYMLSILPAHRRAEGIGYWGLASVVALAAAPPIGLWLYARGWGWLCAAIAVLNVTMGIIASRLPEPPAASHAHAEARRGWIEWRVLLLSTPLFLYSFGYGGVTSFSALYAADLGIRPKSVYLTTLAVVILVTRPLLGRLADRVGYRRVFAPCLVLIAAGLALLPFAESRGGLIVSAIVFGIGFGTAYPVFTAYIAQGVSHHRRGAAFGAILAAFDTGIGTGSTALGWIIGKSGFAMAFGVAAGLAALALPVFLLTDRLAGTVPLISSTPAATDVPEALG
jgi:MFS family permease